MIIADANVFLRHLTKPANDFDQAFAARSQALFERALAETEVFTSSDSVIAEVVFVLTNSNHYGVTRDRANDLIRPLLELPGCSIPGKHQLIDALRFWTTFARLSFVDCLCLAQSLATTTPLMTFDRRLLRIHRSMVDGPET